MTVSVRLTLGRHGREDCLVECRAEGHGTLDVGAEIADDGRVELRLSVRPRLIEGGREGHGDDPIVGAEEGRLIEEDERRGIPLDIVGQHGLGFVGHVMHSVQGEMRVAAMPPVQAYGTARPMPSVQGVIRAEMNPVGQDIRP